MSKSTITNGLVINQRGLSKTWRDECKTHCGLPGPTIIENVNKKLTNQEIGPNGEVYSKHGLGLTNNIFVTVDLKSFCGKGTVLNERLKQCVPDGVPKSMCGEMTQWNATKGQCVRIDSCQAGFTYGGDVCVKPPVPPPVAAPKSLLFVADTSDVDGGA